MKTTKELLEMVLECFNSHSFGGICIAVSKLWIDEKIDSLEYNQLIEYIKSNRPDESLIEAKYRSTNSLYFWERGLREPRIQWLKEQIELTNNRKK